VSWDVVTLSRIQFALTIMFHYIFPPLSIGLGVLLVFMEGAFHVTGDKDWERLARFWTKIFAVNFAVGVATGIVMEFQFGTNWSTYSRFVGDVFGSALAAEGIFAFFLESGFLAVLVFGWDRVSPRMHLLATVLVAVGATFSAVWIVVANSWQQTPAGYHLVTTAAGTRAEIVDFWAMVFNPSSIDRLTHVMLAAYMVGAAFVASVSAWYVLKGRHGAMARKSLGLAVAFGAAAALALPLSGHSQAKVVARTQPAKLAAFEGHYVSGPAAMSLIGLPDDAAGRVRFSLEIPGLLSFLVHGRADAVVVGLDAFPLEDRPPVAASYLLYHAMIACGVILLAVFGYALWRLKGARLFSDPLLLKALVLAVIPAYAANQLGWCAAEVGRQPWVVYGLLRTKDAVSRSVPASHVLASIVMFSFVYALLFAVWLKVLDDKISHGPEDDGEAKPGGWIAAAAQLADPAGPSMTDAKEDD
jgi:cytochrome d ubiquinol oxidase subunit I